MTISPDPYEVLKLFETQYCHEMAQSYDLDEERLRNVLMPVLDELITETRSQLGARGRANQAYSIDDIAPMLDKLATRLERVNDDTWEELKFFSFLRKPHMTNPQRTCQLMIKRCEQLSSLIEKFSNFTKQDRKGRPTTLTPLQILCDVLNQFWYQEKGERFKKYFTTSYELEGADPIKGSLVPANPSSKFFCEVVEKAGLGYTVGSCLKVMKQTIKNWNETQSSSELN